MSVAWTLTGKVGSSRGHQARGDWLEISQLQRNVNEAQHKISRNSYHDEDLCTAPCSCVPVFVQGHAQATNALAIVLPCRRSGFYPRANSWNHSRL